ncbi:hypothetical protein STENM223S_09829 [Streptomyces tendae]
MDFAFDARTEELRARLLAFMDEHVYPAEQVAHEQRERLSSPWENPPVVEELKAEARRQGLWNLFLPDAEYGAGLTNLQYAPLAEITGRSPQLAPTATNCAAPDTGNMEVLAQFGDERQKKQWLEPLLAGEIRSAFAMTEPDVASSDATNITTHIRREGDEYVITGRKWYISGAMHPDCAIFIVMGKTDPDEPDIRGQQSMVSPGSPPSRPTPALAHQTSTVPPSASRASPTIEEASPATARPPISSATALARPTSRSLTTTRAPCAAKRRASAAPMPPPAPVTTTFAPCTACTIGLLRRGSRTPDRVRTNRSVCAEEEAFRTVSVRLVPRKGPAR